MDLRAKFKRGQKIEIMGRGAYEAGERIVTIESVRPRYDEHGVLIYDYKDGLHVKTSDERVVWIHMNDVVQILK